MDDNVFYPLAMNEPNPWSRILVDALLPFATIKSYKKGSRLLVEENGQLVCRFILSGSVEVHRKSDHLLILTPPDYSIFGLGGQNAIYIITAEASKIATLPLAEFHQRIAELNLWEALAKHMVVTTNKLFNYSKILSAPTAYEIICNQLMELMREPLAIREKIPAERYIRDKTHLSRSSIMKILANLRIGGYITIENGRLLEVHHLPSKY
ncbi:hypothetical protein GJV06_00390 [Enterobacteriaceae bacterium RIT691]|nr:hypothetical protein [Enterobacteriaceae bacterium RIT691]